MAQTSAILWSLQSHSVDREPSDADSDADSDSDRKSMVKVQFEHDCHNSAIRNRLKNIAAKNVNKNAVELSALLSFPL